MCVHPVAAVKRKWKKILPSFVLGSRYNLILSPFFSMVTAMHFRSFAFSFSEDLYFSRNKYAVFCFWGLSDFFGLKKLHKAAWLQSKMKNIDWGFSNAHY